MSLHMTRSVVRLRNAASYARKVSTSPVSDSLVPQSTLKTRLKSFGLGVVVGVALNGRMLYDNILDANDDVDDRIKKLKDMVSGASCE